MSKSIKPTAVWLILGISALTIFILCYSVAFPVASVDVQISRGRAIKRSADFIKAQGFNLQGFDKSIIFYSDYYAAGYLQKTQGISKTNQLIREGLPVWLWQVRWFKELKKDGFLVRVDPSTGEIVYFNHFILDDVEGANLSQAKAMLKAQDKLRLKHIDLENYELKDKSITRQKNRTDHKFIWQKKDYQIQEARLRVRADVYGDKLGRYKKELKVPEKFRRYLDGEVSFGRMLYTTTDILTYLLIITGAVILLFRSKLPELINWKFWLVCGGTIIILRMLDFFNSLPLVWNAYTDTVSKPVFMITSLGERLASAMGTGLVIFGCGALVGWPQRSWQDEKITQTLAVGYSLGFLSLGYIALFYLIGTKFFNIWILPETEYSNILAMKLPFLFPLTVALSSAVKEELVYRLFAISLLKRFIKITWLSLLIPALIWGFAHSFYGVFPTYIRGIELTIYGIVLGIVFLRYGVQPVIIAHFVTNAVLAGLPLLQSSNPYFITSGIIVIAVAFLPIVIMQALYKRKEKRGCLDT